MSFISVKYGQKFDPKVRERTNKTIKKAKHSVLRYFVEHSIATLHKKPVFGFKIMACFVDSAKGTIS